MIATDHESQQQGRCALDEPGQDELREDHERTHEADDRAEPPPARHRDNDDRVQHRERDDRYRADEIDEHVRSCTALNDVRQVEITDLVAGFDRVRLRELGRHLHGDDVTAEGRLGVGDRAGQRRAAGVDHGL